jgi:hypothetical protein
MTTGIDAPYEWGAINSTDDVFRIGDNGPASVVCSVSKRFLSPLVKGLSYSKANAWRMP